ncbi:MAG TPA: condensation domain-containing protein, partial [Pyrinomonadaceae bacterium]|nr:condensation domain-containing protein [Pyrinomonadaceae bacterium]
MKSENDINPASGSGEFPRPSTLVELLRLRAALQPDDLAFRFLLDGETEEASLTYGELERQARGFAAWLQSQVAAGDRVLLLYPPGLDYVAAFFGCLYAGVAAVPAYPPRLNRNLTRIEKIVHDAQPSAALTAPQILSRVRPLLAEREGLGALRWLATEGGPGGDASAWAEPQVSGDTLAMLQYTSGSTGTPRGVMLSHANLLHNSSLLAHSFGYTPASRCLTWLPLYHDMGLIGGMLQPLYGGFPCTIMSPAAFLQRPLRWLEAISRHRVTLSGGPNFAYDLCARRVTPAQLERLDLSSWEVAFNGSEPIRHETLERFAAKFAPCGFRREAFFPCYGLAESTLIVSGSRAGRAPSALRVNSRELENNSVVLCAADDSDCRTLVGSGTPLLDQRVALVNPETAQACALGEVGEIWVTGPSVAKGYWDRAEETEQTFRAHLAGGEGPYLRTGDLGFMLEGELYVTGRIKDLIVIRGLNHYPQDIELTVVKSNGALRADCGAAFSVEVQNEERLVVVQEVEPRRLHEDLSAVVDDIRQAVAEAHELQAYAVILIKPGTIPKTSSGKIRRGECRAQFLSDNLEALTEWWGDVASEERVFVPKTTGELRTAESMHELLAGLLAARLGVEPSAVDVHKPISRYGIDSLAAIELMHGIEVHTGVVLPIGSFLEDSTLAHLSAHVLAQLRRHQQQLPLSRIAFKSESFGDYPLSHGQRALWFLYRLAPDSAAYNIAAGVRLTPELNVGALRRSFQALVERHPSLRTNFVEAGGEPVQRVHESGEVELAETDASGLSEEALSQLVYEFTHRPFRLEEGPLLRLALFRHSPREHTLVMCVHHIVADFWSVAVLLSELGILYGANNDGGAVALLPLEMHYTDYALWQSAMLLGPEGERLRGYWERQLSGALEPLDLPTDRPRPAVQTYRGATHHFALPEELTKQLQDLRRIHGATLYMTLLAALQVLLYRHTGRADILVGSPTAGRSRAALAGVVGYFSNPIVLRARLAGQKHFAALLEEVRHTVLEAFEHQDYPFPLLVERLQPERDPSRSPVFQVMFGLQKTPPVCETDLAAFALGEPGGRMEMGGLVYESLPLEREAAQFDLSLTVAEQGDSIHCALRYNTDLFDAPTVARLAGHFDTLLQSIAADPSRSLDELHLMGEAERRQLLVEWNDAAADYPRDVCVQQLFEAQAARTPDAPALVFEDTRLTYRELNARANRLAHHLRALGLGPETLVGVCVERSPDIVAGVLAVLKAGAAFVPLDPAYPAERLSQMIEDSG